MNKPTCIKINNQIVYNAEDIYNYDAAFFIGCNRIRLIIEKKKLKNDDYFFAYQKKGEWIKSTVNYPRAKLFLTEEYVVKNVPKMMDAVKQELYKYEEAPKILELENNEKFKDKNNKIINIEIRGEREHNKIYFKVKDVSIGFEMPNLNRTLLNTDTTYEKNIDYKTFVISKLQNKESYNSKIYLFMTYEGLIKLLYISRNSNAKLFRDWATQKLFTVQFGNINQKEELASSLIGVNHQTIKDVFKTNCAKTPCVYLYLIGKASDILEGEYNENDLLCKFGCTDDLQRRCTEHNNTYKKEFDSNIELLCFSIIEAQYIFDAESNIKQYFKSNLISYESMKELIIINKNNLPQIKQHYKMIQNSYIGRFEELTNKVQLLEKEIIELNNKIIIKDKDYELQKEKHLNELKDKDIELLQYKLKYMEIKIEKSNL